MSIIPAAMLSQSADLPYINLHVPDSNTEDTEVCFVMNGANPNLYSNDEVESVLDAGAMLDVYYSMCKAQGENPRKVLGV